MSNKSINSNFQYLAGASLLMLFLAFFLLIPLIKKWNLVNYLNKIQQSQSLSTATISVLAKYEDSADYLIDYNGSAKIHPGSNFKLFTASAALSYLGPDFNFKTALYKFADGSKTHLLLVGGGDPSLSQKDITDIVGKIAKTEKISGDIYYDESYFKGEKFGPDWKEDWKELYLAVPITGLQINDNLLNIRGGELTSTGKFGIETWPIESYAKIVDEMDYVENGEDLEIPVTATMDRDEVIHLQGDTMKNLPFSTSTTVKDPSLMTARVLKQELLKADLLGSNSKILRISPEKYPSNLELIYQHESAPLSEIIFQMLKFSKNNYAETLVRTLGREIAGNGTQAEGVKILKGFFKEIGIPENHIDCLDGSGLSPSTRATSDSILALFDYVNKQSWQELFWDSLPESKKDGTLKHRFDNVKLEHQVIAKTGTHEFASSLSGKILRPESRNILFSIHVFNHPFSTEESVTSVRPLVDQIVADLDKQF